MFKRSRNWIWSALSGLGFTLASGVALAQPTTDPAALWNDATLYRDSYGTPHVHATTLRSMAFAFGYAQAEDHLETMLMAYRVALGRAAEVGGESFAEGDAFALKIDNAGQSRAGLAAADLETRTLCEGFALGVNAWILAHQDEVPPWVEGVQPVDVLAYWHFLMVTSAPFDLPGVYHPEAPLQRANAWALAPSNTVDGVPLLVMSPFQYYRAPYQWYEAHLLLGGMNWSGATLIGLPVLMMGHNAHLGWALTPNGADTADMFREEMDGPEHNPNDPSLPTIMKEMAPILSFMATAKTYHVWTNGALVERGVPSYVGARGPMLEGTDGTLYSWRNGAFGQFGGMGQLLRMAQATELSAFQDALLLHQLPCFQVVYADKLGNIFYLYNARTGNRNVLLAAEDRTSIAWDKPLEANLDPMAWSTVVAPGELPHLLNPDAGYLQACGTPPWLATTNSGLDPANWPAWLVPEDNNYRTFRVRQILSAGRYGLDDMEAMLFDTFVPAAADMVPLILSMAKARPELVRSAHPDLVTGLGLLGNWNLAADRNSEAMAYYSLWWSLIKRRYQNEFPSEVALYRGLLENTPAAQESVLATATDAARAMRNDFNRLAIRWGDMHRLRRGGRDEPMFGSDAGDAIFYSGSGGGVRGRHGVNFGYGFAMAVALGEQPYALSIVPFGASENPDSPHYADQMTSFLEGRMKETLFSYEAVIREAGTGYGRRVVLGAPGLDGYCAFAQDKSTAVRLETVTYPPRPYPTGLVPFTNTVRPIRDEEVGDVTWELEWRVPEALCKPENLNRLRFYTYTRDDGWVSVLRQRFDSENQVFTGSGTGAVMIAIMGPPSALEVPTTEEAPAPPATLAEAPATDDATSGAFVVAPQPPAGPTEPVSSSPEMVDTHAETAPVEAVEGDEIPQPKPLFDIEFMGGAGNQGDVPAGEVVPGAEEETPSKKGIRGFLKKVRGKE